MEWHCLGHAMHLADADGLRLLFDPLLEDVHHGGVFEVVPPRAIDARELRPDFIFVSHRHPDHFDIKSLRSLAALDAESVVITPDALVARTCGRLGFGTVRLVAPSTRVELDTISIITTPSRANLSPIVPEALEWGVAVQADGATVWNQIDTVHDSVDALAATIATFDEKLALALVPWCPLLEVEASMGGRIGFPFAAYGKLLEHARALDAVVVPSSAGARHRAPFQAMNALVYPVGEARFLADMTRLGARALPAGRFVVSRDGVEQLERLESAPSDFKPFAIPELFDPNLAGRDEQAMLGLVDAWVPRLAAALPSSHSFLLEVVFPSRRASFALGRAGDWDVRNEVCGSMLCDVIEGKRHWGDLLLAGMLRACTRAYDVGPRGLQRAKVPELFVYAALSYAESVERAVEYELTCS
jgi:hypothetical protein